MTARTVWSLQVVNCMVWSAQEFQWITAINIATQYLVSLPVTVAAIGEASRLPTSILLIGVGNRNMDNLARNL